ncbi:MAG: ATP-binding protein [Woeseiaceae bacterium]
MKPHARTSLQQVESTLRDGPPDAGTDNERLLDCALARVARLESALAATAGTLHDVNNLLTVLSGSLYLMTEAVRKQPDLLQKSRRARNTAERASALIRELLAFTREPAEEERSICPARHATEMEALLRRGIPAQHKFKVAQSPDPWSITASASQFESAVANLVKNAHEALTSPGAVTVRVDNVSLRQGGERGVNVGAGDYVRVQVSDNGTGIPVDVLSRVTDPLFTTKAAGHGSGMGLAMVRRFAEHAGGALSIDSVEGRGTTVTMWLPRAQSAAEGTANMTLPLSTLPSGDESVLLVIGDAEVRATVAQLLEALGYTVIPAGDRADAIVAAERRSELSAVVCDRAPADRDAGEAWFEAIRRARPGIRQLAILESGVRVEDAALRSDAWIHRPITIAELARSMRQALGS